jgi:hypothetical protein
MVESVQTFYKELSPILEKHRDSLDKLVDGTQASKVTVWRWLNKINTKYPDPNKLLSILSKISGMKNIKKIGIFFGGDIKKYLEESFPGTYSEDYKMAHDFEDKELGKIKDFYTFLVYTMCGNFGGASKTELINTIGNVASKRAEIPKECLTQELINSYGVIAIQKINDLLNFGVIELKSNGKYHRTTKNMHYESDFMMEYYPKMIKSFFRPEEVSLGFNVIAGYQETIPSNIANEIAKDTKDFFLRCKKKMDENSCENGIPYQIINFGERLTFETLNAPLNREVQ